VTSKHTFWSGGYETSSQSCFTVSNHALASPHLESWMVRIRKSMIEQKLDRTIKKRLADTVFLQRSLISSLTLLCTRSRWSEKRASGSAAALYEAWTGEQNGQSGQGA
jgi:hypothetical protein